MRRLFARKNPFFRHSDGEFFVAYHGGTPLGRIGLFENRNFNRYTGNRDARFYFYDAENSQTVADALFDLAENWTRSRGLTRLIGPQGFSSMAGGGILIQGFDQMPAMTMMGYNYPYYQSLLESAGFTKYKDFVSAHLDPRTYRTPEKISRVASIAMKRGGFDLPRIRTRRQMRSLALEIGRLYNESWRDHEEFAPLTEEELLELSSDLMLVTDPKLLQVIRKGDELAGFVLTFPDLTEALIRGKGKLNPLKLWSILREKHRTSRVIINGLGIHPRYRNNGGTAILYHALEKSVRGMGREFVGADLTQVAETTELMLSDLETLGAKIYKRHRVYYKLM
jgi:GNAT superfamily N-acetyltransferase